MKTQSLSRLQSLQVPHMGSGSPRGGTREAKEARADLKDYLRERIGVPMAMVDERIDKMTLTERIHAEVEMLSEQRQSHSYDYDPLAYGRT